MSRRVTDRVSHLVAAAALAAATASLATSCANGCDAKIAVDPVVVRGGGAEIVHLDLAARVTLDGKPAAGVDVVFDVGWAEGGSGGKFAGSAKTGSDGVARLHRENALGPLSALGPDAATWTKYKAEPALLQPDDAAAKTVCAGKAEASFKFEP